MWEINYKGITLKVFGYWDDSANKIEISDILWNNMDVTELLTSVIDGKIEEEVVYKYFLTFKN